MTMLRAHSRTFLFLSFAVAFAVIGVAWWLLSSETPKTSAQVVADACDEADLSGVGTVTTIDNYIPGLMTILEYTETVIRYRLYHPRLLNPEQPVYDRVIVFDAPPPPASSKSLINYTNYERHLDEDVLSDWVVENRNTPNEFLDTAFCGFEAGDLTNLQYGGEEMVDGVTARYYTAILEPDKFDWEMWVGPNGPIRIEFANEEGIGGTVTYSDTMPNIPIPVDDDDTTTVLKTPTPVPADTPTPEPTNTPSAPGEAKLDPNPETVSFSNGQWREFTVHGTNVGRINLLINVDNSSGPTSTGAVELAFSNSLPSAGDACETTYYSGYTMNVGNTFSLVGCEAGTVIIRLEDRDNDYATIREDNVTVNSGP